MSDPQTYADVEQFDPAEPELTPEQTAAAELALELNEEDQGAI